MEKYLRVGVISSSHGVRGEAKVFPTTDDVQRFKKLKTCILDTGREYKELHIESVKFFKQMVILKFKKFFKVFLCPYDFPSPEFQPFLRLAVWKFHNKHRLKFSHQFIHFFLSITSCLTNHKICKMEKWTFILDCKTITRFYKWTHALRKFTLCCRNCFIRKRA